MNVSDDYVKSLHPAYIQFFRAYYELDKTLGCKWSIASFDPSFNRQLLCCVVLELIRTGILVQDGMDAFTLSETGKVITEKIVGDCRYVIPEFVPPQ